MFVIGNVKTSPGTYDLRFKFVKPVEQKEDWLEIGYQSIESIRPIHSGIDILEWKALKLEAGISQLLPFLWSGGLSDIPILGGAGEKNKRLNKACPFED